ncbi:MAG: putative transporter [Methanosaeta sp. PtaU1.Bin060]|nr:MAG: putative transporter [Methanosaeta sp. PtaU1.Bin060]
MPTDIHSDQASGSSNRYIILLLILTGVLMAVVDGSVVSIALPTITGYFQVSLAESEWIMTSYLVALTSLLLIFGKVAEYTGRARLFLLGVVLFTSSSLACGVSSSLGMLILFRIIQATGAAMMFSISSTIIFQAFPRGEQGRAMGYIGATVAIGSIIGPTLGGVIVDLLGWKYIFLINVPIGLAQLLVSSRYLKIEEQRSQSLEVDWIGAVMLVAFLVSLMALLGALSVSFTIQPTIIALAAVSIFSLAAFVAHESRHEVPLLDLSIFGYRGFVLASISMILFFVANLMISVLGPFYFEGVMGYTASQVGLIYLIVPAIMVVGAPVTGWIYDRHPLRYFAALGMMIMAASMIVMGYLAGGAVHDIRLLLLAFVTLGVGGVLFQSPNNTEVMRALPLAKMNIASSFTATIRNLGMALGVSLSGVLISLQLAQAGYYGTILEAGPELLSSTISRVMIMAGMLCILGTLAAIYRGLISA